MTVNINLFTFSENICDNQSKNYQFDEDLNDSMLSNDNRMTKAEIKIARASQRKRYLYILLC